MRWTRWTLVALVLSSGVAHADEPQLDDDLGAYHRPVATSSKAAQAWFDQGLTWLYAFNHDEAIASFRRAADLDPTCSMVWWGIAVANGPHINFPLVPPDRAAAAWAALEKAKAATGGSDVERALVDALSTRYANPQPDDRRPLDVAYAEAMGRVRERFPKDADVATLYAEALMDLQPWDLWTLDGKPKGRVQEVVETLERAITLSPSHPGALHLHVHALESGPDPARAKPSADLLRTLVPGAGHLVHMPCHVYVRTADFDGAIAANEAAIRADERHRSRFPRTGFYQIYMAHNRQFLCFAAMLAGRSALALDAAKRMVDEIPKEFVEAWGPVVDGFLPIQLHAMVRFGRWDDVLAFPPFADGLIAANAVRRYARGVALTALGRTDDAKVELAALEAAVAAMDDRPMGNNPAKVVLQIPRHLLAGELRFRLGQRDEGLAELREAVKAEDALVFDDPPDWMMAARHPLGAALLEAKRWDEAEATFRADLARFPENGWALYGLLRVLHETARTDEFLAVQARYQKAWAKADVTLHSPCFCQPGR
ncbi:MAG: tetratricopeptide repeat protein [Planctomycetota bacterium]